MNVWIKDTNYMYEWSLKILSKLHKPSDEFSLREFSNIMGSADPSLQYTVLLIVAICHCLVLFIMFYPFIPRIKNNLLLLKLTYCNYYGWWFTYWQSTYHSAYQLQEHIKLYHYYFCLFYQIHWLYGDVNWRFFLSFLRTLQWPNLVKLL